MQRAELINQIKQKKSFLCIGLDPDFDKMPASFKNVPNGIFEFNKAIIDATADLCVAYKPNLAFYELHGPNGLEAFKQTVNYIGKKHLIIADAKRGDIGNTANFYAKTFFEYYGCNAITLSPYMGADSIKPFTQYKNKWAILLALTSNLGSQDLQEIEINSLLTIGNPGIQNRQRWAKLYEHVLYEAKDWGTTDNIMFVVGATKPESFIKIRNIVPNHFLLVPGVGSQGGDLDKVMENGLNSDVGLLINVSRSIIYADNNEKTFAVKAREKAIELKALMQNALVRQKLI